MSNYHAVWASQKKQIQPLSLSLQFYKLWFLAFFKKKKKEKFCFWKRCEDILKQEWTRYLSGGCGKPFPTKDDKAIFTFSILFPISLSTLFNKVQSQLFKIMRMTWKRALNKQELYAPALVHFQLLYRNPTGCIIYKQQKFTGSSFWRLRRSKSRC